MSEEGIIEALGKLNEPTEKLPGVALAETVNMLTGQSVSPLLFYGGYGAYKYFKTPSENRENLLWVYQPFIWGVALFLCIATFFKDTLINLNPAFKPVTTVIDTLNSKATLFVCGGAAIPLLVSSLSSELMAANANSFFTMTASAFSSQVIAVELSYLQLQVLMLPVALFLVFVVFMATNIIDAFILLSPIGAIDSLLKFFKLLIPLSILSLHTIHPMLGLAFSLLIISLSLLLLPMAFRLTGFSIKL